MKFSSHRHPVRRALAAVFVGALAAVAVVPAGTAVATPNHSSSGWGNDPLDQTYLELNLENVEITNTGTPSTTGAPVVLTRRAKAPLRRGV